MDCDKHKNKKSIKPGASVLRSSRFLHQLRVRIRYLHDGISTETAYAD